MLSTPRLVRFLLVLACGTAVVGTLGSAPPEPKLVVQERAKSFASQYSQRFALSGDGSLFAVVEKTEDKCTISIRKTKTHEAVRALDGLGGEVWRIAIDPTGKYVAATNSKATRVWALDVKGNGEEVPSLRNTKFQLAFSPNGRFLAGIIAEAEKYTVAVWDVVNRKELKLPPVAGNVSVLAFSPDSKHLALGTGEQDSKTFMWSGGLTIIALGELKVHKSISFDKHGVDALCYAPDGKSLAVGRSTWELFVPPPPKTFLQGERKGQLQLWDTTTWKVRVESEVQLPISAVAYSPDGALLAYIRGPDSAFHPLVGETLWYTGVLADPNELRVLEKLPEHGLLPVMAFSRSEKLLVTASNKNLHFWDYTLKP